VIYFTALHCMAGGGWFTKDTPKAGWWAFADFFFVDSTLCLSTCMEYTAFLFLFSFGFFDELFSA